VRIPNSVLVNPDLVIDKETGIPYTNNSALEILINSAQDVNANDLPILGRQFLSSAYVMLNQDSGQFTLWEANPTTNEDLVAVDVNNRVVEKFCTPSLSNTTEMPSNITSTQPTTASSSSHSASAHGISRGAIAGIVVGSIAGIAGTAGLIYYYCIRSRRNAAARVPNTPGPPSYSPILQLELNNKSYQLYSEPQEMFAPGPPRRPGSSRPRSRRAVPETYELDGSERWM